VNGLIHYILNKIIKDKKILLFYMKKFNDIILRKYFNISDYLYSPIDNIPFFKKRKYNYFLNNTNTITIGYIINTINGLKEYPLIDMKNIKLKKKLNLDFKNKFNDKIKEILIKNTYLPLESIFNIIIYL